MELTITIITAIVSLLTASAIWNYLMYRKQTKRIKDAEALREEVTAITARDENYEKRIQALHESVATLNTTITEQGRTISTQNHALDDKTLQIRKLTDEMYQSQKEVNRVNDLLTEAQDRNTALTAEIGDLRLELERYRQWHCRKSDCAHRLPPNPSLAGKQWEEEKTEEPKEEAPKEELQKAESPKAEASKEESVFVPSKAACGSSSPKSPNLKKPKK